MYIKMRTLVGVKPVNIKVDLAQMYESQTASYATITK